MIGGKNNFNLDSDTDDFLYSLEKIIQQRLDDGEESSYISSLKEKGISRITQKVGEEAVEIIIEALKGQDERFLEEAADLLFHYLILLRYKGYGLDKVIEVLQTRHQISTKN